MNTEMPDQYSKLLGDISHQILQSRYRAAKLVNRELLLLYYAVGKRLSEKIAAEKWGAKVLEQLADDLQKKLPGLRGFSHRNLKNMRQFAEEYVELIGQMPSAQLENIEINAFFSLGFSHHILLLNRCKDIPERAFYMQKAVDNQWTHEMLDWQIKAKAYQKRDQKLSSNFARTLPETLRDTALQAFKDEYLLDFINVETDDERVVEKGIVQNIKDFILKAGKGFAFIGNQHRLLVDDEEFFVDLLFYNRHLKCLIAIELKKGKFRPAYAGQLNFYLNVLNDQERLVGENPAVGIVLCSAKNDKTVEYAFQAIHNPMGVATYQLSSDLPAHLRDVLPDPEALKKLLG
ncbi:PDDEXK nuclease domain-containing protein [Larkinella sp. GY13]|uniref:PDDEXK nuclease domain-containing protein n=1 Tax=Larkinella sp. GY13 TaxID=3453720 RepID=UPI003EF08585